MITSAIGGTLGLIFLIIWAILGLYALFDVLKNGNINIGAKTLWVLIIMVVPILGSLIFLFWRSVKDL